MAQYTDDELYDALRRADAAGDAAGAKQLVQYIQQRQQSRGQTDPTALNPDVMSGFSGGGEEPGLVDKLGEEIAALPKAALLGLVGTRDKADLNHPLNYLSPWGSAHDVAPEDIYRAKGVQQAGDIATSLAAWMSGEGLVDAGLSMLPRMADAGKSVAVGSRLLKTGAGSLASQAGEGHSPEAGTTAADVAIAEGMSLALGAPGRAMNMVKNFLGRPDAAALQTAEHLGISPSLALSSGGRGAQAIEGALSKSPGGAGVMANHENKLLASIDGFIERAQQKVGGRAGGTTELGDNIRYALNSFIKQFSKEGGEKYDKFWQLLPKNTRIELKETKGMLDSALNRYADDPAFQSLLDNPKLAFIQKAIEASGGKINVSTARALRTDIGSALSGEGVLASDAVHADFKQLYGALSRDINDGAASLSPAARSALAEANTFWSEGRNRIEEYLEPLAKEADGDKVFKKLFGDSTSGGMKELGPVRAKEILDALPAKVRGEVVSEVIHRMGHSSAGKQGAAGDDFSMATYLTNWNKMNPKTKAILFSDPAVRKDMDELANFAEKYKGRSALANTSNTAPTADILGWLVKIGGGAAGLFAGGPIWGVLGAFLAPVLTAGTSHVTAKMMTNPNFIKWMAKVSRTQGPEQLGKEIGKLLTLYENHPDLRGDVARYVDNE